MIGCFCCIAAKDVIVNSVTSGVSGPNVTRNVHCAEKFILFNIWKSKLREFTQERNHTNVTQLGGIYQVLPNK